VSSPARCRKVGVAGSSESGCGLFLQDVDLISAGARGTVAALRDFARLLRPSQAVSSLDTPAPRWSELVKIGGRSPSFFGGQSVSI
jgi:hypothetical protein